MSKAKAKTWIRAGMFAMVATVLFGAGGPGCAPDEAPSGVRRATKYDGGPTIVFDLARKPTPEIPLPNDVATWPDPTSRTGRRINASLIAATLVERHAREQFSKLEGWGTYAPISIPFDKPLDTEDIKQRHANDDYDFKDDTVYLVNLKTGVPVPLDIGAGNNPQTLRSLDRYWANDQAKTESNLLLETREEDLNGNGILDPGEDTDFDGVLDHPNFPGGIRPPNGVDGLFTFYESETNSLLVRPMLPLEEMTEYAVVVTDRLHGSDPKHTPIQSPFEYIHHPTQRMAVERLAAKMEQKPEYYGFTGSPLDHVQFVFTFTTQPTVTDMFAMRDGVWGQGKLAWMAAEYPPVMTLLKASGRVEPEDPDPAGWVSSRPACTEQGEKTRFIAKFTPTMKDTLKDVIDQVFNLKGASSARLLDSFDNVAYIAVGKMKVPWLLGDVKNVDPEATIELDPATGQIPHSTDEVTFFIVVPKTTATHKPPFPVTFYGHGYTGNFAEGLGFAGEVARHGVATVALNAPGHGVELSDGEQTLAKALFGGGCLTPFARAFGPGRIRNLNGDKDDSGNPILKDESGRDYWTAYMFHTRDMVRQAVVEQMMVTRMLKSFDGKLKMDWDGDGKADEIAGDFDGDGTVDIGGPETPIYAWGESLGGILSGVHGGVDPNITAAAPTAGGGALTDIGIRSFQGGVVEAVTLRWMAPIVVNVPAEARLDRKKDAKGNDVRNPDGTVIFDATQKRTACKAGEQSLRFIVPDLNRVGEVEFACVPNDQLKEGVDVLVHNTTNDEVRCAQVTFANADYAGGSTPDKIPPSPGFRVHIPSSIRDGMIVSLWKPAPGKKQAMKSYGKTCEVDDGATMITQIDKWVAPPPDYDGRTCIGEDGKPTKDSCVRFQTMQFQEGSKLVSPAEGFGLRRQTPELRKLMQLAQIVCDPADPITFAPYYYLKQRLDPFGKPAPKTALLQISTIGDMNVPVNAGIAAGRVSGAIPFLRPDNVAAADYPDYVVPAALLAKLGNQTPNQVLLANHAIEGISRLGRHPAGGSCQDNFDPNAFWPPDAEEPARIKCNGSTTLDKKTCDNALFDVDSLSDGALPYDMQALTKEPLRLARIATPATAADLDSIWAPRLKPNTAPSKPLGAVLTAYIVPQGVHGFDPPDPCKKWDDGMYLTHILAHFFKSGGTDLYYLSHWDTHKCAAVTNPASKDACNWGD